MAIEINWRSNLDAALKEAKEAGRPVVLELYLDGCPHCARLHQETHADPAVAAALNTRFIPVRLEGRGHLEVVRQYNVTGAPTTLVIDGDGKELHRFAGFYPPEEYLAQLSQAG